MKRYCAALFLLFFLPGAAAGEGQPRKNIITISDFMSVQHHYGKFFYNSKKTVMVTPGITFSYHRLFFNKLAVGFETGFKYHRYDQVNEFLAEIRQAFDYTDPNTRDSKNIYIGPSVDYYFDFPGFKLVIGIFTGFDEEITTIKESSLFEAGGASVSRFYKNSFALKGRIGFSIPLGSSLAFFGYYRLGMLYSDFYNKPKGSASDETMILAYRLNKSPGVTMVNSISFGIQYYR